MKETQYGFDATPSGEKAYSLQQRLLVAREAYKLHGHRFACGRYKRAEEFAILDDWKSSDEAHRRLREPWIGRTVFVAK